MSRDAVTRVAYLVAPRSIELRSEPVPTPEPGGIVVRVRAALSDGTDLKAYRRGHPQMPFPSRFGHEFSGDVIAADAAVEGFGVGDAVMLVHSAPCDACFWCAANQAELCERVMSTKILGAYADAIAVPAHIVRRNVYRKPDALSYEEAAFLEPLACVMRSLRTLAAPPPRTLAVVGGGGFGILHVLAARTSGVERIVLVARNAERLALARRLGIDAVDVAGDPRAAILARTEGRGVDAVVETTGTAEVWEAMPDVVRRGGAVVLFGGLPSGTRVSFDAARLHYDEITLHSPFHFTPDDVRRAYEALAHRAIDVRPLVTHRFALERIADAFSQLDAGVGVKVAIAP